MEQKSHAYHSNEECLKKVDESFTFFQKTYTDHYTASGGRKTFLFYEVFLLVC